MNDDQFTQLNSKIDKLSDTLGDQILKLYQRMEQHFDELDAKIETKADKDRVEAVYNLLDASIKKSETDEQERLFLQHQVDRHADWINQLAGSTKTKLVPEP